MPPQTIQLTAEATTHTEPHIIAVPKTRKSAWLTSSAVIALFITFAVDASARVLMRADNYAQPNKTWAWWVTKSFRKAGRPDVAILGSSLMVATVVDADATYLDKVLDQVVHHRSMFLEHLLEERTGKTLRTQSFAIGGQMATDSYAITDVLLTGKNKPEYIVYGIAPRDFVDATFTSPNSSETARYMRKIAKRKDILGMQTSLNSRLDDAVATLSYLYNHRDQILLKQYELTKSLLISLGWQEPAYWQFPATLKSWAAEHLAENEPKDKWGVEPFAKGAPYSDNRSEYRVRYNPFKKSIYNTQIRFYEKLLAYCKDNNIKLLIFNMPITAVNQDLMPSGMYATYQHDTAELATKYGAEYVDLNKRELFPDDDFRDTCHMNGKGALKFWEQVAQHWQ